MAAASHGATQTAPGDPVLFPYEGDYFSGSYVSSLLMARALADRGWRPIVVSHGEGRVIGEAAALGLETVTLPRLSARNSNDKPARARLSHARAYSAAAGLVKRLRPKVIHTNDLSMLRTWCVPARAGGAALIAHWRSNYRSSMSVDLGLRLADAVIAVSQYSKDRLPLNVQQKTVVEYNALPRVWSAEDRAAARAAIRATLGVPAEAALIGVFGVFTVRKRTHLLTDILAELKQTSDGRPVFGLACGEPVAPVDELFFARIKEYGLEDRLLRPGFVRPVEDWMAACDAVLSPSEREPLSRSVLEARAVGTPVIVSEDGGLVEIVRHDIDGLLLPPGRSDMWIDAVRRVLDDRGYADRLSGAALEQSGQLMRDPHGARVDAIYRRCLAARRPVSGRRTEMN